MKLLSTLILGGAVAFASPAVFAAGHGHGGNGHHHGGHGGGHNHGGHNHGGHNHGGNGHNHGGHHHHHSGYWPSYNVYRPNYGYGVAPFPYYGAYGVGSPYYRGSNGFSLFIGR